MTVFTEVHSRRFYLATAITTAMAIAVIGFLTIQSTRHVKQLASKNRELVLRADQEAEQLKQNSRRQEYLIRLEFLALCESSYSAKECQKVERGIFFSNDTATTETKIVK